MLKWHLEDAFLYDGIYLMKINFGIYQLISFISSTVFCKMGPIRGHLFMVFVLKGRDLGYLLKLIKEQRRRRSKNSFSAGMLSMDGPGP